MATVHIADHPVTRRHSHGMTSLSITSLRILTNGRGRVINPAYGVASLRREL